MYSEYKDIPFPDGINEIEKRAVASANSGVPLEADAMEKVADDILKITEDKNFEHWKNLYDLYIKGE